MIAIKVSTETLRNNSPKAVIIGQIGDYNIIEVESEPEYAHEVLDNTVKFIQRVFAGKYGEEMTYPQLDAVRSLVQAYGEADSRIGLMENRVEILEDAFAEYLEV